MKQQILVLGAALLTGAVFTQNAHAQSAGLPPLVGATSQAQGGVFKLPDGVEKLAAVDAQNAIVAQMRPDDGEARQYRLIQVKHVYAGGIAMLFGGSGVIPTAPFVSPGFANGGQNGQFGGNQNVNVGINGGNPGGNGFFFPQNNFQQPGGIQFTRPNGAMQPLRPNNQPGLGLGTPFGNFFVPARNN